MAPWQGSDIDGFTRHPCQIAYMDLVREAKSLTYSYLRTAELHFGRRFILTAISFDLTGSSAGRLIAHIKPGTYHIKYNRLMLEEHPEHVLQKTVPHEVAHLVAYQVHGPKIAPHGKEWKAIMSEVFCVVPQAKHRLDISRVTNNCFVYKCACPDEIHVTKRMHAKILRGTPYKCKLCDSRIQFVRVADTEKAFPVASRLLISSIGAPLTDRHIRKAMVLLDRTKVSTAVLHGDGVDGQSAKLLAKALSLSEESVLVHPSASTIPDKISHALFFLDQPTESQIAAIEALKARNTVVRVVKHPSKNADSKVKKVAKKTP